MPLSLRPIAAWIVFIGSALLTVLPASANATVYFSGHVSDSHGNPVAGALIEAGQEGALAGFDVLGQTTTDQQGNYSMTTLGSGDGSGVFVLLAQASGYLPTLYPNVYCSAPSCANSAGAPIEQPVIGANFTLLRGASIVGHVTRADTSAAVSNSFVTARMTAGVTYLGVPDLGHPDSSGSYSIESLPPGSYTLDVTSTNPLLLNQWYAGHDADGTVNVIGDVINLGEGQVFTADFQLNPGATLSGLLTSALNGAPVDASVEVSRIGSNAVQGYVAVANSTAGSYQTAPLAAGSFYVQFLKNDDYLPLFYPQTPTQSQAQMVTVTSGQQVSGIDAQLTPVRAIAGRVTDGANGQPLQGVAVHAGIYFNSPIGHILQDEVDTVTDATGNYMLQGIDADSYYIWATSAAVYIPEFYPQATPCCTDPVGAAASLVAVGASEQKTGIDLALSKGASISGYVHDADTGYVPAGLAVSVIDANGVSRSVATTDASGAYTSSGLSLGSYYVAAFGVIPPGTSFYYPSYVCTNPNCSLANAQAVQLGTAQDYPNIDLAIPHLDLIFRGGFDP